jgi:hypothetical protein
MQLDYLEPLLDRHVAVHRRGGREEEPASLTVRAHIPGVAMPMHWCPHTDAAYEELVRQWEHVLQEECIKIVHVSTQCI